MLLLDFDGVVHRGGAYRTKRGIVSSDPSIQLFEYAVLVAEALEPYPDVEIVLSTSWVEALGFRRARDALPVKALRDRIVGATYHSQYYDAHRWAEIARGQQVLRYVNRHHLVEWLAIDDCSDGFETVRQHLVLCDVNKALGDPDTQDALARALRENF
ncbi:HAD domain-containing protein [Paraburkholderia fungorum]|uniref:HAD domain-containing protein n=1 Tax=Paraburkholderia fungorum TaxID=134537 RepID=UPI001FC9086C|nr:HAD domain-containing protein [Paraburkholderia fungorum]